MRNVAEVYCCLAHLVRLVLGGRGRNVWGCAAAPKFHRHLRQAAHGDHGPAVAAPEWLAVAGLGFASAWISDSQWAHLLPVWW